MANIHLHVYQQILGKILSVKFKREYLNCIVPMFLKHTFENLVLSLYCSCAASFIVITSTNLLCFGPFKILWMQTSDFANVYKCFTLNWY